MLERHLGRRGVQDECLGLQSSRPLAASEVVSLHATHARWLLHFLRLCSLRWASAHEALAYMMALIARNDPLAHTHVLGSVPDTSSTATYNQIAWSVGWIRAHTLIHAAVDDGIRGYVAGLSLGLRPSDRFPCPILL